MRRAASTKVVLHPCKRQSALYISSHKLPPPRRTLHRTAREPLPWVSSGTPNQSEQHAEKTRRDPADVPMQKRILNVRPWKRDYTLLHAMAFVRELERRFGRVSHIYMVKDSVNPREYQQQFTVIFENIVPAKEITGLLKDKDSTPVLTAKWSSELEKDAFRHGGPSLASLREYLAHAPKCDEKLSNNYGVMETDAIEATLHIPSKFFFLQGKQFIPLIPRPIRNRFIQSLLDFGGFASNPPQQMRGILEFHKRNLQQHGHVNKAWEETFRSDSELRGTRQALSRITHSLPKAAQLHAGVKDNTASTDSQDVHHSKPVHELFDGTELRDLSLGASEIEEDFSLLDELASHAGEVQTGAQSGEAKDAIPYDIPATEAYGVLGEEESHVSGHHEEKIALHSTVPLPKQPHLNVQSVGAGPPPRTLSRPSNRESYDRRRQQNQVPLDSATAESSFRKFEISPPLTEDDEFKLGRNWLEGTHGAREGSRQTDHFAAPRRRVFEEQPWPEPLPASAFVERPRGVAVETPKISKQGSDEERAVLRTLRKRLSSFLDGTKT